MAFGLVSTGLGGGGYLKATTIMSLEQILLELEQGKGPLRDPERYFLTIFGTPSDRGKWGCAWRDITSRLTSCSRTARSSPRRPPSRCGRAPGRASAPWLTAMTRPCGWSRPSMEIRRRRQSSPPRQPHAYRVQGPTFLIEFNNTQNGANHIHSICGNMLGDFGIPLAAK